MKRVISYILMIMIVLTMMACSTITTEAPDQQDEVNGSIEGEIVQTDSNSETVYPFTITDGLDRTLTFETEPQTIITLAPSTTEIVYALGAGDRLIGRTKYCNYPEEALDVASIGSLKEPDIELIIALNPDLILASTHFSEEVLLKLEEVGLNVVVLIEQESFDGVNTVIEKTGKILNQQENAALITENMKAELNEVLDTLEGVEAKSVYYVVGYGEYGDYTATGDTFLHEVLEMAGGKNIAADGTDWSYNLESIIEKDPEFVICSTQWDTKAGIEAAEGYNQLSAVKNGNLVELDPDIITRLGPRLAEGTRAIAETLHPESFNN